jgi:hypothetical protein
MSDGILGIPNTMMFVEVVTVSAHAEVTPLLKLGSFSEELIEKGEGGAGLGW